MTDMEYAAKSRELGLSNKEITCLLEMRDGNLLNSLEATSYDDPGDAPFAFVRKLAERSYVSIIESDGMVFLKREGYDALAELGHVKKLPRP